MLSVFYRNRRAIVVIVAFAVIFSGFGAAIVRSGDPTTNKQGFFYKRRTAFVTTQGYKISRGCLDTLKLFLASESTPFSGKVLSWNFLNEDLITKEFLTSPLGEKIFCSCYLKEGWASFEKEKKYKPYRRFDAPFISAEEVWKTSAPTLWEAFARFKAVQDPISKEGYEARVALFVEEKNFPYTLLKEMLEYRRRSYSLPIDSSVTGRTFNLFEYKNLNDWFGEKFIENVAKIILNFSGECASRGVTISRREVKEEFLARAKEAFSLVGKRECASLDHFIAAYLKAFDVSESAFLEAYKHIVLFQRGLQQMKGAALFDFEPFRDFLLRSRDSIDVEYYRFPKEYVMHTQFDLQAFETYFKLTAVAGKGILDLPSYFLPVKVVKQKEPRLVGRHFTVSYSKLFSKELEKKLSISEVRDWQREPDNFISLTKAFPKELSKVSSASDLTSLDASVKRKIDDFSRKELVKRYPQKIAEALGEKEKTRVELFLAHGKDLTLEGICDGAALAEMLLNADSIPCFTQDGNIYYAMQVEDIQEQEEILPFKEAHRKGILKEIIATHPDIVSMTEILAALKARYGNFSEEDLILRRLQPAMEEYRKVLSVESSRGEVLKSGAINWIPEKHTISLFRSDTSFLGHFDFLFSQKNMTISSVLVNNKEGPYCYQVLGKVCNQNIEEQQRLQFIEKKVLDELLKDYLDSLIV